MPSLKYLIHFLEYPQTSIKMGAPIQHLLFIGFEDHCDSNGFLVELQQLHPPGEIRYGILYHLAAHPICLFNLSSHLLFKLTFASVHRFTERCREWMASLRTRIDHVQHGGTSVQRFWWCVPCNAPKCCSASSSRWIEYLPTCTSWLLSVLRGTCKLDRQKGDGKRNRSLLQLIMFG